MFTIFKRPKPLYRVWQIVHVTSEEENGYYMQIREMRWVKQNGRTHWDWFYIGPTFAAVGTSLSPRSEKESHREQELSGLMFLH